MKIKNIKKAAKTVLAAGKTGKAILKNPYLTGLVLGGTVCVADQLLKSSIERQPDGIFPHDVTEQGIGTKLEFRKRHNNGIALEKLSGYPEAVKVLTATGMSAAAAELLTRKKEDTAGIIGDCLALGGAASNALDRMRRGYVVDYLHIKKGPLSKIVFNLGDAAIAAGMAASEVSRFVRPS